MSPGIERKKRRKRWPAWSEEEALLTVIGRKVCIGCPVSLVWWCVCGRSTSPLWMLNGRFSMTSWTGFTRAVPRWCCPSCPLETSPRSTSLTGEGLAWFGWPWCLRGCWWLGAGVGKHKTLCIQCLEIHFRSPSCWHCVELCVAGACLCCTSRSFVEMCFVLHEAVCRNLFCAV